MKKSILSLFVVTALAHIAPAHGPMHAHRGTQAEIDQALDTGTNPGSAAQPAEKTFDDSWTASSERQWGASISTGWESRHVHYGVDETGPGGAYTTEVGAWLGNLAINVWSGFGTGSEFQEWDFTAAYNVDLDAVFLLPGYNLRYTPELTEEEHEDHHEEEEHSHNTIGNEVFLVLGTNKIPYITPSAAFVWDFNNTNANSAGAFLEFRVDGDIPIYKEILSLQPYALLGLNFGYNTEDYDGWNNFQFGTELTWSITPALEVFGGVNYSLAMTALETIGQGNVVWANAGIRFTY